MGPIQNPNNMDIWMGIKNLSRTNPDGLAHRVKDSLKGKIVDCQVCSAQHRSYQANETRQRAHPHLPPYSCQQLALLRRSNNLRNEVTQGFRDSLDLRRQGSQVGSRTKEWKGLPRFRYRDPKKLLLNRQVWNPQALFHSLAKCNLYQPSRIMI